MSTPFYTYRTLPSGSFIIEDPRGDILFGDRLLDTEMEAAQLCRAANAARRQAFRDFQEELIVSVERLWKRM